MTVAVVVVVGGLWCGQIACSAKAHALQPTRATFAFDDLPLLVGGGAGVHGHEEEGPALPGPRPLPLLCLVVVLLVCSSVFLAHPLDYSLENHADEGLLGVQCSSGAGKGTRGEGRAESGCSNFNNAQAHNVQTSSQ